MKTTFFILITFLSVSFTIAQTLTHNFDNENIIYGFDTNKISIGSSQFQANLGSGASALEITSSSFAMLNLSGTTSNVFLIASDQFGHQLTTAIGSPLRINNILRADREYVTINTSYVPTDYKLAVGGDIIAEGVRVELEANWPDYVFTPSYNLMPLAQVEEYIEENGHLPNVPSAQTMEEEGIDLGDMVTKQMEKIEELTLYIIALQKEIETLKAKN